jgi:hypothetical protein
VLNILEIDHLPNMSDVEEEKSKAKREAKAKYRKSDIGKDAAKRDGMKVRSSIQANVYLYQRYSSRDFKSISGIPGVGSEFVASVIPRILGSAVVKSQFPHKFPERERRCTPGILQAVLCFTTTNILQLILKFATCSGSQPEDYPFYPRSGFLSILQQEPSSSPVVSFNPLTWVTSDAGGT